MRTTAERWLTEAWAKGKADALVRVLAHRFDADPEETRNRLANESIEDLDARLVAALSASSLDDVFRDGPDD